jgi:hypothetical protein
VPPEASSGEPDSDTSAGDDGSGVVLGVPSVVGPPADGVASVGAEDRPSSTTRNDDADPTGAGATGSSTRALSAAAVPPASRTPPTDSAVTSPIRPIMGSTSYHHGNRDHPGLAKPDVQGTSKIHRAFVRQGAQ